MSGVLRWCVGMALGAGALVALAQQSAVPAEDAIRYRQSVYQVILWNFKPLGAMANGRMPFDQAQFVQRAERVAALATQLLEGFPAGSEQGARTDAKPEIWKNFADFSKKAQAFEREAQALVAAGRSGDATKIREQFAKTSQSCKACHDKYRKE